MSGTSLGTVFPYKNPSGNVVWKVEVPDGYLLNGRRRLIRRTAATKAEAKALKRQLLADIDAKRLTPAREKTLEEYGLWWVRSVKANHVRYSTATDYEDRLRRWVFPHLGKRKLSGLKPDVIEEWMNQLKKKGLSTATVNGARTILFGALQHAYQTGLLQRNPVALVKPHRKSRDEKTAVKEPWSNLELRKAIALSAGTDLDAIIKIALVQGLRRGEILGLQWKDIDFDEGSICIRRTLKEERRFDNAGKVSVSISADQVKTRASERKLAVGFLIAEALHLQKIRIAEMKIAAGDQWIPNDWVFPSSIGAPTNPNNMHKRFAKFCKEHGLRVIRFHDMRHTAAVEAISRRIDLAAISQGLGHSRIETTKAIYAPYVQTLVDVFSTGMDDGIHTDLMADFMTSHEHQNRQTGPEIV